MTLAMPPIADYGIIGDTRTAALLAHGSVDWLCLPRFDSDPVFGRLVGGEAAGGFSIAPGAPVGVAPTARYRPDSALVETVWRVEGAEVRLTDGLVAETGGMRPQSLLVRRIEAEGGPVEMRVRFDPRLGERHTSPRAERRGGVLVCTWGRLAVGLTAAPQISLAPGEDAMVEVVPGRPLTLALAVADRDPLVYMPALAAWGALQETDRWWRRWVQTMDIPAFARDPMVRSLITLRLLTYAPSGAPVASVTTSLPEWPGGQRNWDYRYTWPRDTSIGIAASLAVGNDQEATAFLYWLLHAGRVNRPRLPPALRIDGRPTPPERQLDEWPGYQGARPVRVGNAASRQHQLDGYGWVVDAAWAYQRGGKRLFGETWRMVAQLTDFVASHWGEPDAGIWEPRDHPRHYVHSKLMGWVALDRALRMAGEYRTSVRRLRRWRQEREALARDIRSHGFDPRRGSYLRAYGSDDLDAALLLLPILEFEPPGSPRIRGTVDAVRRELSAGSPLLFRYTGSDGLEGDEGAFLPCAFWLVQALAATGRVEEAQETFVQLTDHASPMGLYAEEVHPHTGEHLGNTPMMFTHAALLQACLAIQKASTPPLERGWGSPSVGSDPATTPE
jgi:GH15 family glucan-1,4-alpha-glucosidase